VLKCSHESCGREQRVWLPKNIDTSKDDVKISRSCKFDISLHYWCKLCGSIKNISDDRPKKMGYWINILSKISKEYLISQSQKRLVIKELDDHDCFEDYYGTTGSAQRDVFVRVVKKHCGLYENMIDSYIY
jgi:hypothetical protein